MFVVFGIYFTWFWAKGQTLAQKTWLIRVVDTAGQPITQARALLRYLLSWVWFLPPLAAYLLGVSAIEVLVLLFGWVAIWAILSRFHPQRQAPPPLFPPFPRLRRRLFRHPPPPPAPCRR